MTGRSAEREIQELLEFRCVRRLRTVHALLQEANGLGLLADPLMEKATAEIVAGARARHDIQRDIKQKERAREILVKKYKTGALPEVRSAARARLCSQCSLHHRAVDLYEGLRAHAVSLQLCRPWAGKAALTCLWVRALMRRRDAI